MINDSSRDNYVVLNGTRFHYVDWGGDGPVLVCLHGAGGNAHHWDTLAQTLQGELRIIALDQRGHGNTDDPPLGHMITEMANDIEHFVEALSLSNFNLLGHSMGARISLVYAGQHSEKIHKLVLSDPPHYPVEDDIPGEIEHYGQRPNSFASKTEALEYLRKDILPGQNPSESDLEDRIKYQMDEQPGGSFTWRVNPKGLLEAMKFVLGDVESYLRSISCPTLLLRGERSHLLSMEFAQHMASVISVCDLVEIKNAGHGTWRDNPDDFFKEVRRFLLTADN